MKEKPFRVELDIMTSHGVKTFIMEFEDVIEADACYRGTTSSLTYKNMVEEVRFIQEVKTIVMKRTFT